MQFFEFLAGPFGVLRNVNGIDEIDIWGAELGVKLQSNRLAESVRSWQCHGERDSGHGIPSGCGWQQLTFTPDYTINAGFEILRPIGQSNINWMTRLDRG